MVRTVKVIFIVLLVYLVSLFFRSERLPSSLATGLAENLLSTNFIVRCGEVRLGLRHGLEVRDFWLWEREKGTNIVPLAGFRELQVKPVSRVIEAVGLTYSRLPDSYYAPENIEKNARVEVEFPALGEWTLVLREPDILAVTPARVEAEVKVTARRVDFHRIHLDWKDADPRMKIDGHCYVDISQQKIYGEVKGHARQSNIRPMLVALDVPVAFPYFDGFTEVTEPVPASCAWQVLLENNDFNLWLDLDPTLGRYNGVPMRRASGQILLRNQIRGHYLNYHQTVNVTNAVGLAGELLSGDIDILGTNGYNEVTVNAKSSLAAASLLKIAGFSGDYVNEEVIGQTEGSFQFRFPRAMTNNYEVMDGWGHCRMKDGQIMRMSGFKGLIDAMPSIAPAVSWLSDTTQASCDYVIEKGVLKTKNILIAGTVYAIRMEGEFDTVKGTLDFNVRVQFFKNDNYFAKYLVRPFTSPFERLLLEFHLSGTPDEPKWTYVSVLDRVKEALP